MADYTTKRAYLELHISVLLWGFTGILGRLITIDSTLLVWYRLLFTVLSLLLFKNILRSIGQIPAKVRWQLVGIGSIAALHWVTFYGAIHLANVSVAVGSLATTSLFTAFLEPIFTSKKIKSTEIIIGLIVSLGLGVMFFYGQTFKTGIIMGLVSAFLAGTFTTLNKIVIDKHDPSPKAMTFVELGGGWLFLCILIPILHIWWPRETFLPQQSDLVWLLILALICTTLPFILSLRALKKLSAFSSVLAINLEPIYSIFLALLIFQENEELNLRFYIGTAIVILAIFTYPLLSRREKSNLVT